MSIEKQVILLIVVFLLFMDARARPGHILTAGPLPVLKQRGGLPNFFLKVRKGQPVSIAFLGGSITEAAGYRVQTEHLLKQRYPKNQITTVNAGIGGTGSPLGAFRLQHDVLDSRPDLIFVDFAVNDMETDSLTFGNAMEGIVRQVIRSNPHTDLCFLYTINEEMIDTLRRHTLWRSMRYMDVVASYYNIPSIYLGDQVMKLLDHKKLLFSANSDSVNAGSIVFTQDGTHPTDAGHSIYSATIMRCVKRMHGVAAPMAHELRPAMYADSYEFAAIFSPDHFDVSSGWKRIRSRPDSLAFLQLFPDMLKMHPTMLSGFPDLVYSKSPEDSIEISFNGTMFGIGDIIGPSSTGCRLSVDGSDSLLNRFDSYCSFFRRSYYVSGKLPPGNHRIVIRPEKLSQDKFAILAGLPGNSEESTGYDQNYLFIGHIMLTQNKL